MSERVLVLRTCNADMTSRNGFRWPESGVVECPDWSPEPVCGQGLHGLLWGEGNGDLLNWSEDAKWLVVAVDTPVVDLDGKVKFGPLAEVVCCGDRLGATSYIQANGGHGRAIIGGTATAGDRGTATAGYRGTATAGDSGTATAGNSGTAMAGDNGTATAGNGGVIVLRSWDNSARRWRLVVGYPGKGGILPGAAYRLDGDQFVPADPPKQEEAAS